MFWHLEKFHFEGKANLERLRIEGDPNLEKLRISFEACGMSVQAAEDIEGMVLTHAEAGWEVVLATDSPGSRLWLPYAARVAGSRRAVGWLPGAIMASG